MDGESVRLGRWVRLWGKKRGQRMTGWWFVGSVGEAAFFVALCLLGILTLATVLVWQLFSPETQVYRIGFGFWVMVAASSSFIAIGGAGFIYRVLQVATSDEHRRALAGKTRGLSGSELPMRSGNPPMVPGLQRFTDSPGVKLAYRLPGSRPEMSTLILSAIFALAWNSMTAVLLAIAVGSFRQAVDWWLIVWLPFFIAVGFFSARWFFRLFRRATGIGITTVEVSDLPLVSGKPYRLYVVQYGRLALRKMRIALVCEEQATYHHGTDLRTERQVVFAQSLLEHGRCRIDFGRPLELECSFTVPRDVMHSFQSEHNSVSWKVVVEGEANRWPSYCRSFPVIVYPVGCDRPGISSLRS